LWVPARATVIVDRFGPRLDASVFEICRTTATTLREPEHQQTGRGGRAAHSGYTWARSAAGSALFRPPRVFHGAQHKIEHPFCSGSSVPSVVSATLLLPIFNALQVHLWTATRFELCVSCETTHHLLLQFDSAHFGTKRRKGKKKSSLRNHFFVTL